MIIQLTDLNNNIVYINTDKIVWFNRINDHTSIRVVGEQYWNVQETPEYIFGEINRFSHR